MAVEPPQLLHLRNACRRHERSALVLVFCVFVCFVPLSHPAFEDICAARYLRDPAMR